MDCDQTHIALIERDGADEDFVDPINKAVVRRHLVSKDESKHWPRRFVGHPVAVVQPDRVEMDVWV
ncbi:hypothetical protein PC120_g19999 [Phytophthora cactorum]|nr:hypothetical protein PC120_g19999 [Phytophthora cactorum]